MMLELKILLFIRKKFLFNGTLNKNNLKYNAEGVFIFTSTGLLKGMVR